MKINSNKDLAILTKLRSVIPINLFSCSKALCSILSLKTTTWCGYLGHTCPPPTHRILSNIGFQMYSCK